MGFWLVMMRMRMWKTKKKTKKTRKKRKNLTGWGVLGVGRGGSKLADDGGHEHGFDEATKSEEVDDCGPASVPSLHHNPTTSHLNGYTAIPPARDPIHSFINYTTKEETLLQGRTR
ncbi:hypothetical protein T439DRAFT_104735 [Meredithblackwellia eburnea MCA 4105]